MAKNERAVGTREWRLGNIQAMKYCVGKAVYSAELCSISGKKRTEFDIYCQAFMYKHPNGIATLNTEQAQ